MIIRLESTTRVVTVDGVPARIWEGRTEAGILVHAFITRLIVHKDIDAAEFERELRECRAPSAEIARLYPTRLVL